MSKVADTFRRPSVLIETIAFVFIQTQNRFQKIFKKDKRGSASALGCPIFLPFPSEIPLKLAFSWCNVIPKQWGNGQDEKE